MTTFEFPSGFNGLPQGEQLNSLSAVKMVSVPLTYQQLTHLHSAPITVLPPPGHGLAYVVINSVYQSIGGDANFVSGDSGPGLYYGLPIFGGENIADGGNGNSPFAPQFACVQPPPMMVGTNVQSNGSGVSLNDWVDNAPLILSNVNSNMTGGGGATGRLTVLYFVIPVA